MKRALPFFSGVLFAVGLCVSGMTQPMKIENFLDFAGTWDPSLAFVMGGAILAHFGVVIWAKRAQKPIFAERFAWPESKTIDARLIGGAAIFGVGWGLSGYCPGPAIVSIGAASRPLLAFLVAMGVSTFATRFVLERKTPSAAPSENSEGLVSRS